jgi:hypothetical protein
MAIRHQRDFWSGLLLLGVGLGATWVASAGELGTLAEPGGAVFPLALALLLALLGGLTLVKAMTLETEQRHQLGAWAGRPLLSGLAGMLAFALLLPRAGGGVAALALLLFSQAAVPLAQWRRGAWPVAGLMVLYLALWAVGLDLPLGRAA